MARRRIFLAEDDEDDQLLFTMAVKEIDDSILLNHAKNGVDTLTKLNNMHKLPGLIFMDFNMPLMNGFECLRHLKKSIHFKNIPVVILTSAKTVAEEELARVFGANFFLLKPFDFSLLRKNITDMLNLFLPVVDKLKRYEHINMSLLPAGMESHIISLLEDGLC